MTRGLVRDLFLSSHPEPVAAVTALSGALALAGGRGWATLGVLAAVLSGQLGVGWMNDYLDRDRDAAAGRADKPVAAGKIQPRLVRNATVAALVLCIPFSLLSGVRAALAHFAAVGLASAYNWRLDATPFSVLPYALAFPLLLVFLTAGAPHPHPPHLWALLAAGLLASGAHFTQVLPDIEADRSAGKLGLPQRVGPRAAAVASALLLAAAAATIGLAAPHSGRRAALALAPTAAALLLAGCVLATALTNRRRLSFHLTVATAAASGAAFLAAGGAA